MIIERHPPENVGKVDGVHEVEVVNIVGPNIPWSLPIIPKVASDVFLIVGRGLSGLNPKYS